jgi:aquaporin Z
MNPVRSLGPAFVLNDWTAWWAYLAGPVIGGAIAVGVAYVLRGPGGGLSGTQAATGTLGIRWQPGRIGTPPLPSPPAPPAPPAPSAPRSPRPPGEPPAAT